MNYVNIHIFSQLTWLSQTVGDGEKLLTHLNSALKVLLGLDIFPRMPKKKKLNFVDQCYILLNRQWYIQCIHYGYNKFNY